MINLYKTIANLFYFIENIAGSDQFILAASITTLAIKCFILYVLITRSLKSDKPQKSLLLLLLVIIGSLISDSAWIITSSKNLGLINISYKLKLFWNRIAWAFYIIYYQALALFIEGLCNKKNKISLYQKIFLTISSVFSLSFIGLAFFNFNCLDPASRTAIEMSMYGFSSIYMTLILMPISIFIIIQKVKNKNLPQILKKQLKVFIQFIIAPVLIADLIQVYPFSFVTTGITNQQAAVGFTTIFITYAIIHCMRKIMGLRFLNFHTHVQSPKKFSFIDDFKNILDQFSQVTSTRELGHITQNFFKDALQIPTRRTRLYIRDLSNKREEDLGGLYDNNYNNFDKEEITVENFLNNYDTQSDVGKYLRTKKIIITDELEFSNFYDENQIREKILEFMHALSADIFIPIFENNSTTGYIIIERYARIGKKNSFYSNVERDQMLVFTNYLGNIIKLLQTRSFKSIIKQEKKLREELYSKHQEINQYKESIRSFLKKDPHKQIGVIFYKNKRFTFGNQTAQKLIPVKLNTHDGHPTTKKLKKIGTQVLEYKSPQTCFLLDAHGEKLVVSALPNTEQNNVIMIIYYPEISDLLKKKISLLKDPTQWDYLLYLETTKSGKLIKELIPGNSETILNFKIDLLKIALSNKAILLDMPDQDLLPTIEIIHHISLREQLHILDLQKPSNNFDTAIKLFGINPLFGMKSDETKPLLEKLNNSGTLVIKNIHFLELETQKYLAEFIKYGYFKRFKGEQKTFSSVRIICSTNANLKKAVQEAAFCSELFNELNNTTLSMPSLMTLPEEELENLTSGFTEQAIKTDEFQHILELSDTEKKKLAHSCPASFAELKNKVQQILVKKSKQSAIYEEAQFDPAYDITDPQLVEAVRLGKHALRDRKIMEMLWEKFKNQNQIATLLGVNRSSVNRRCREYNLD